MNPLRRTPQRLFTPHRKLRQINILKSGGRKINIAPPPRIVPATESMAQDRVARRQPRISRDIRIRNRLQIARQPIDVQSGVKIAVRVAREIELSSALLIARARGVSFRADVMRQAPVVPQTQVAPQNGTRIAVPSTRATELRAQARSVPLMLVGPQNGIRIAAHSTPAPELKTPARIVPQIPAAPQTRTKEKIPTSTSAPIPIERLDNSGAREYRTSP